MSKSKKTYSQQCPKFDLEKLAGTKHADGTITPVPMSKIIDILKDQSKYVRFIKLRKKSGKIRRIVAPSPEYKTILRNLLLNFFKFYRPHEDAHGFVMYKSIVSNAKEHAGCYTQVHIDIKDFFDNITSRMVARALCGNKALCSQCTDRYQHASDKCQPNLSNRECNQMAYPDLDNINTGNINPSDPKTIIFWITALCTFYDKRRNVRYTPQGFPTSPAITNFVMGVYFDRMIKEYCELNKLTYSRYADDISITSPDYLDKNKVSEIITYTYKMIASLRKDQSDKSNLQPNTAKTAVHRGKARRKICGIVVNDNMSIQRTKVMKFRAELHNILVGKGHTEKVKTKPSKARVHSIVGTANFYCMVNKKYEKYLEQAKRVQSLHG